MFTDKSYVLSCDFFSITITNMHCSCHLLDNYQQITHLCLILPSLPQSLSDLE